MALDKETGPIPGGVGYGMFYTNAFRTAFARGTSFYYEIVCPHQPADNVTTWLYLTATNRSQRGVEAFVSYNGQKPARHRLARLGAAGPARVEQHHRDRLEPMA